nr:hypothetical protein [Tanacetum cinerariifolium]
MDDRLVRAATTASSLEAERDSGNIAKTQSKATPNESSSQGTDSGGDLGRQDTMGDVVAQTRLYKVGLSARVESSDDEGLENFDTDKDLQGEEVVVEQEVAANKEPIVDAAQVSAAATIDKGKAKMIEEPLKLKKKDQILFDEEVSRELQEEIYKEEILVGERARQEEEDNIALIKTWKDIQAKVDADYQLAERL